MILFFFLIVICLTNVQTQTLNTLSNRNPKWSSKTFAPFVDILAWPTPDITKIAQTTKMNRFTMAFVTAGSNNLPSWGGVIPMSNNFYASQLSSFRSLGGEVICSFGGANGKLI
jgi:hypothetical protein